MHVEYTHCIIASPKLKLGCIMNSLHKEKKNDKIPQIHSVQNTRSRIKFTHQVTRSALHHRQNH